MASQSDVREVVKGEEKSKRRFDARDWTYISEYMCDELATRKNDRRDLDKAFKDIDRQLAMQPEVTHKLDASGKPDIDKAWMPETELPGQSITLETLTADARRMMFPDSGTWFEAIAALTDEYLERVDFQSLVAGDENEVPSRINQDNANKLVVGVLDHWHGQYDFEGNLDLINAESFKYGVGVGRARLVTKRVFLNTARGVVREDQRLPVLFPRSIKNTYLDASPHALMNEGFFIGPSVMFEKTQKYEDLVFASNKGSTDPDDENGGWMPKNLKTLSGDNKGNVQLLEYEGDLVVPRKTVGSIFIPGAIVTIAVGKNGDKAAQNVVRFRFRKDPFSSYILFPYHNEHIDTPYASSPLMKGWPLQKASVEALNRLFMSAALKTQPPTSYDKDDMYFASRGGLSVYPGVSWGTMGKIEVHDLGGDPQAMFTVYAGLQNQYADVTGMHAPRLGAQTVSHTTAYAKDAELSRGVVRTVDYVKATLKGPMTQWLHMALAMGKRTMKESTVYIDAYGGFVTLDKKHLPDHVVFKAHGAGGPQEEQAKTGRRIQSMQMALGLEQMRGQFAMLTAQTGIQPKVDLDAAIEQVLRDGGWIDLDQIVRRDADQGTSVLPAGPAIPSPVGTDTQDVTVAPGAALQTLAQ